MGWTSTRAGTRLRLTEGRLSDRRVASSMSPKQPRRPIRCIASGRGRGTRRFDEHLDVASRPGEHVGGRPRRRRRRSGGGHRRLRAARHGSRGAPARAACRVGHRPSCFACSMAVGDRGRGARPRGGWIRRRRPWSRTRCATNVGRPPPREPSACFRPSSPAPLTRYARRMWPAAP